MKNEGKRLNTNMEEMRKRGKSEMKAAQVFTKIIEVLISYENRTLY